MLKVKSNAGIRNILEQGDSLGGVNLLPDTKNGFGTPSSIQTDQKYKGCLVAGMDSFPGGSTDMFESTIQNVDEGDVYTFSFWAKGTSPYVYTYFYNQTGIDALAPDGRTRPDGFYEIKLFNEWKRYSVTYQMIKNENYKGAGNRIILIRANNNSKGESLYIAGMKLEKGPIATDWTPAPEDIEARLAALETALAQLQSGSE